MNSDFAGSSSHDDRRRRRLLSEQTDSNQSAAVVFVPGQVESSRNHRYPVKRIIHYRAWKIWMTSICLLICGGGLLYAAWTEQSRDLGKGFSSVFNVETGRVFPVTGAGLLFLSGQLAWLIGWARSRSLTDYSGSFRVWRYIGLFLFAASFGVLIDADRVLIETLDFAELRLPWSLPEWNWIIPTGVISLILLWFCDREMRTSKLGRTHLWCAAGLLSAGVGLPLVPQLSLPLLAIQGLILGGLIGLLTSLMWFARQVFYFSAEPSTQAKRPGVLSRILEALKRRRSQAQASAEAKQASRSKRGRKTEQKMPARPVPASQTSSKRRRGIRRHTEPVEEQHPETPDREQNAPAKEFHEQHEIPIVKLDAAELSVSTVDEEILRERIEMMELLAAEGEELDLDVLKGLTKKQKKRLRTYWRELERSQQIRKAG